MKLFLAALALLAVGSFAAEGAGRPNVLFLFSDDQRADTIGALGNAEIRTPALDGLARRAGLHRGVQSSLSFPKRGAKREGEGDRQLHDGAMSASRPGLP